MQADPLLCARLSRCQPGLSCRGPSSPNPPLLQRRASSPVSSPSLSRPRIDSFSTQCCHPCAHTWEQSRRCSCSVESYRRCCLCSALLHAALPGCRCQPLNADAHEQSASLAKLLVHHLGQGVAFPMHA
jgi:hypothetical protein